MDNGYAVQQTTDEGYIIAGWTLSLTPEAGGENSDFWLIKTNDVGDTLWTKTIRHGAGNSVQQTKDRGYIVAGDINIGGDLQLFLMKISPDLSNIENDNQIRIPSAFTLHQNYPNPFNPSTTIEFTLPKTEFVELKVYNILGKEVSSLVSNKLNQGSHTYTFDGKNLASGIYYYKFTAGDYRQVKTMILLR